MLESNTKDIFDVVKFENKNCENEVKKLLTRIRLIDIFNRKSLKIKEIYDLVSESIDITIRKPIISTDDECKKLCSDLNNIFHKMVLLAEDYYKKEEIKHQITGVIR